ncbi:MAG: heavy-metal-associated domain-containing protein [Gemmatimonadota bacterium]|nr:heavy-metal-associated domain-containing protein [Gemmatimonadota bacterium]
MKNRTVQVPNISCGHCVVAIQREVSEIEGVLSVEGRHDTRDVTISWNSEKTSWQEIEGLMSQINYPPVG